MQRWAFLFILEVIILQTVGFDAKLTAMPKTQLVSACVGDTVSLEVEIGQSESPVSILWKHGSNIVNDHDHYTLSEGGKKLTILDILPPHSGHYFATVKNSNTEHVITFTVNVRDIFLRLLVQNPVTIPLGGKGTLKVSKSEEGALWWFYGGEIIKNSDKNSHYRILDAIEDKGSVLEISDAQPGQAGIYEVILKSGSCEIRNLIQVNVGEDATDNYQDILQILLDNILILAGSFVVLTIATIVAVCFLHARSKKRKGNKSEEKTKNNNSKSDNPVKGIILQEPTYNVVEESLYGEENIYDDPNALLHEMTDHSNKHLHVVYNTTEDTYGDNLGIYAGLNDIYGQLIR